MQKILVSDHGSEKWAALFENLPLSDSDLRELVELLMGRHEFSGDVLRDVYPGSIPDTMGAEKLIYLIFENLNKPDEDHPGGVYLAGEWVIDSLDPAMPEDWGAAMSQPMMFPLVADDGETFEIVESNHQAKQEGVRVGYGIIVSPMERAKTGPIKGYFLDSNPDAPILIPIN